LLALIVVFVVPWGRLFGPERSAEAYCRTWQEEGERLHAQWSRSGSSGDIAGSLTTLMGAPEDLAHFFDTLADVAPDDIRPDVERYRDAWSEVAGNLGDNAANPLYALMAQASVALRAKGAEDRIDAWTRSHCATSSLT
jgi:hypothetical protein